MLRREFILQGNKLLDWYIRNNAQVVGPKHLQTCTARHSLFRNYDADIRNNARARIHKGPLDGHAGRQSAILLLQ